MLYLSPAHESYHTHILKPAVEALRIRMLSPEAQKGDIMRFRKKPVEVDAIQYTGSNAPLITGWAGGKASFTDGVLRIETEEGVMIANVNDWVIRGVKGEFYPCKPDIFEMTYELVEG